VCNAPVETFAVERARRAREGWGPKLPGYDGCMTKIQRAVLIAASMAAALVSQGQQVRNTALKPLTFLSGRWASEKGSEVQEESWSPVTGDSMIGSFRILQAGRPIFYEFWVVEMDANRPVLKLKHFNADLAGWEEKSASTKMPLISSSEDDAVFAEAGGSVSLHYHRVGDMLTCTVHHVRNGKGSDETFALTRTSAN
jgi:Domain of unknown function (DUF6265)